MSSVADVLRVASGEVGYWRHHDPLNGTKYGRWYAEVTSAPWFASNGVPYCAMFVSWVMDRAGVSVPGLPTGYCPSIKAANGLVDSRSARPGDIVLFDWDGDQDPDHVGIVEVNRGGHLQTIEGNTSRGGGSQGDGGWVARRTRGWSVVDCVVRPSYDGHAAPAPQAAGVGGLAIDGDFGPATTTRSQQVLGTPVDGVVSGQHPADRPFVPSAQGNWTWECDGSLLVMAVQRMAGADVDGLWGPGTNRAVQVWLIEHGYDCGPCGADGYLGGATTRAWQRWLNDQAA